VISFSAT